MSTDAELIERLRSMSCYDYAAARQTADRLAALIAERDKLKEALAPFAAIVPSSLYPDDGSENEGYVVILKRDWGNEQVFTGGDLARARAALSPTPAKEAGS